MEGPWPSTTCSCLQAVVYIRVSLDAGCGSQVPSGHVTITRGLASGSACLLLITVAILGTT